MLCELIIGLVTTIYKCEERWVTTLITAAKETTFDSLQKAVIVWLRWRNSLIIRFRKFC